MKQIEDVPTIYDYIIGNFHAIKCIWYVKPNLYLLVGAGSAGSVIANRLGEDTQSKILLLEAGPYIGSIIDIPALTPGLHKSEIDWQYETVSQKSACYGFKDKVVETEIILI